MSNPASARTIPSGGLLGLVRGDCYLAAEAPRWVDSFLWPSLAGRTVTLRISGVRSSLPGAVSADDGGNQVVSVELTSRQSAVLPAKGEYRLVASDADGDWTLEMGVLEST